MRNISVNRNEIARQVGVGGTPVFAVVDEMLEQGRTDAEHDATDKLVRVVWRSGFGRSKHADDARDPNPANVFLHAHLNEMRSEGLKGELVVLAEDRLSAALGFDWARTSSRRSS